MNKILVALLLSLVFGWQAAFAETERIINYHSDITVDSDSSLLVEETITVYAGGYNIKRGIFRDFPTRFTDDLGITKLVGFKLLEVKRDGVSEPHHLSYFSDAIRIYIGEEDVYLEAGKYTYSIRYKTDRQLRFFADHDELYWNVTGNFWEFPIEQVSADVHLPARLGSDDLILRAFTGLHGSTDEDYVVFVGDRGDVHFETSNPLRIREGLTIVVGFPKGTVPPPTAAQMKAWWIADHRVPISAFFGVLLVFCYFFLAWLMVGVDPKPGVIRPGAEPPDNLSPAALRYIRHLQCDHQVFVAAILNMGAKGWLRIVEESPGIFWIHRNTEGKEPLAHEEEAAYGRLFLGRESLEIDQDNHSILSGSRDKLSKSLAQQFKGKLFFLNHGLLIIGVFMSVIATLFSLSQITYANQLINLGSVGMMILGLIITNIVFSTILPRYTRAGRAMRDAIEGYMIALKNPGAARLNLDDADERKRFNSFLPYAVALGVQDSWSRQVEQAFEQSGKEPPAQPDWYRPSYSNHRAMRGFTREMSSTFSSSLSSAGTAPSSSSSGSSGGSSGGGGGGGGGGGW